MEINRWLKRPTAHSLHLTESKIFRKIRPSKNPNWWSLTKDMRKMESAQRWACTSLQTSSHWFSSCVSLPQLKPKLFSIVLSYLKSLVKMLWQLKSRVVLSTGNLHLHLVPPEWCALCRSINYLLSFLLSVWFDRSLANDQATQRKELFLKL